MIAQPSAHVSPDRTAVLPRSRTRSKACIDQENIDANLASLPIFLAGCKQLVVLAGTTYPSRLWCVMELYVYLRMGGSWQDIRLHVMSKDALSAVAAFDAGKARCYHDADRHKLLAVIDCPHRPHTALAPAAFV